eukprot:1034655-Prymnesium_polylepis.1
MPYLGQRSISPQSGQPHMSPTVLTGEVVLFHSRRRPQNLGLGARGSPPEPPRTSTTRSLRSTLTNVLFTPVPHCTTSGAAHNGSCSVTNPLATLFSWAAAEGRGAHLRAPWCLPCKGSSGEGRGV